MTQPKIPDHIIGVDSAMFKYLADYEDTWHMHDQAAPPDENNWGWSPLNLPSFNEMLAVAAERAKFGAKFLELGSGIGTKLYLAAHGYGLDPYGIEIHPVYREAARALRMKERTLPADLRHASIDWQAFDIVYTSRPFRDDAEEEAWEHKVIDSLRPGAVLISAFCGVKPYDWECLYRRPWRGVWVKPTGDTGEAPASTERPSPPRDQAS